MCAVLTGTLTDSTTKTKDRIRQGYQFKEFLDKALAMNVDYSLLHVCFETHSNPLIIVS